MIRRLYLFLTELLYHQFAWTYDGVAALVSAGLWQEWVRSILPDLAGHRILELGHGPGHLQAALLKGGQRVVGLDKSPQMTRQAVHRLRKQFPPPASSLVHGDAFYLPFAPQTFDCVAATFPTNYVTARETVAEVYRVLAPGGKFIVMPGARLVAPHGAAQHFAGWIYRVFGLSQDWSPVASQWFANPMRQAGFIVSVEKRPFEKRPFHTSEIFVIIGHKL